MSTLTRILINPRTRGGGKLLTEPQAMHAAVQSCFPPDIDPSESRILWRLDSNDDTHTLYVVGPEEPDPRVVVEQAGWATRPGEIADYSRFLGQLKTGQEWAFRLTANPVRSLPAEGKKRGKVVPHVTVEQQLSWLEQQASKNGFDVIDASVTRRRDLSFEKGTGNARRRVTLRVAQFDGQLRVTDADQLRRALTQGIGRARAYGCGLLTLARPQG